MESLEGLRVWKSRELEDLQNGKMTPPSALYKGQNWVGVIPPKILRETLVIGSPFHCRMQGTKSRLEYLMRRCRLRSARTVTGHAK